MYVPKATPAVGAIMKSTDASVRGAQSSRDWALLKGRAKGKRKVRRRERRYTMPYWATLSPASHAIYPSNLGARVSSTVPWCFISPSIIF